MIEAVFEILFLLVNAQKIILLYYQISVLTTQHIHFHIIYCFLYMKILDSTGHFNYIILITYEKMINLVNKYIIVICYI